MRSTTPTSEPMSAAGRIFARLLLDDEDDSVELATESPAAVAAAAADREL